MISANREAPGDNVLSRAGADKRGPDSDGLRAIVRFGVVDLSNVVLGHAAFQHVHGLEGDRGKRIEILRRGVPTPFETWGKRLARHAPNVIQSGMNVQPAPAFLTGLRLGSWQSHRQRRARFARADLDAA